MITLCGFSVSNYYNIVKMALLEKGVPFAEEYVGTGSKDEAVLSVTPLGKIPFIRTDHGALCETQVILDFIETSYPTPALVPDDAFAAAKVRELVTFMNLHLELVGRELYGSAFFGAAPLSDSAKERVRKHLEKNIAGFKRLTKFSPYIAGDTFTQADCVAFSNLPLTGLASKLTYGEDLLIANGLDYKPYCKMLAARPSAVKVNEDRKLALAAAKT